MAFLLLYSAYCITWFGLVEFLPRGLDTVLYLRGAVKRKCRRVA
jgi:hypothetical protein